MEQSKKFMVYSVRIIKLLLLLVVLCQANAQESTFELEDLEVFEWDSTGTETDWERRLERSESDGVDSYGNDQLELEEHDWEALTDDYDYREKDEPEEEPEAEELDSELDDAAVPWYRSPVWKYVTFGAVLLVLVIVLVRLLTDQRASNVAVKDLEEALELAEEDLAGADLRRLLEQAREESDLRMMIRIRYLMLIQRLDDRGLINYRKDRSNWSYHADLAGATQQRFGRLTQIFDFVWYGNVQPTEADEHQVAQEIEEFMGELGKKHE